MTRQLSGHRRTFLVEQYWPGVTQDAFRDASTAVRTTVSRMEAAGSPIAFLHATLVPADETAFCVLEAPDAALVEQAYGEAGIRFERVVEAVEAAETPQPVQLVAGHDGGGVR